MLHALQADGLRSLRKAFLEQGAPTLLDEMIMEYEGKYFSLLLKGKEESKKTAYLRKLLSV